MKFIFHNSPYWIRRDGAPSLCFLRFIIVLMIHYVPSQNKRLKARKESPLLSLQHRAENNQCNPKLFAYPQCHRDLRSSVMVQINHTARVKSVIIYILKKKSSTSLFIASREWKRSPPVRNEGTEKSERQTNNLTCQADSSVFLPRSGLALSKSEANFSWASRSRSSRSHQIKRKA